MQVSIWEKESFYAPKDVIIIGSGLAGLWTALYLKKKKPGMSYGPGKPGPGYYKPGHKYSKAPPGWKRHAKRPVGWSTRGCIVVGPVWFCP